MRGVDRGQTTLFPECLEDWIGEDNPVRVVDVFVEEIDLAEVRAPGSKVTLAPVPRSSSDAWKSGSIRTVPVK